MTVLLIVIIVVAIAYGKWRLSVRRFPYTSCRACGGTSRTPGSNKDRFGRCRQCGGTGRRPRRGARV